MIIFRNPGLIELDAVRNMGVSVKLPGAFGYFGTGLKFAIATILRGGGSIAIHRGEEKHVFTTKKKEIRGEDFDLILMDKKPMGITTQLGRNWEPWMVLRELGCNALDEGGTFYQDGHLLPIVNYDETTIVVGWPALEEAYEQRDQIFFGDRPVISADANLQVAEGRSDYVFYRGIRALKLERPSKFTYNILALQTLTEDRHLIGDWNLKGLLRRHWLVCEDRALLEHALVTGANEAASYEDDVDYANEYESTQPSKVFLDICYDFTGHNKTGLASGARAMFMKNIRQSTPAGGYSSSRFAQDAFGMAVTAVGEIFDSVIPEPDDKGYFQTDPLGIEKAQFVVIETELPDGKLSMVESGRIYVTRALMREPKRVIAEHVVRRLLEAGYLDPVDILLPIVLQNHEVTRLDRSKKEPELQEEPLSCEEVD